MKLFITAAALTALLAGIPPAGAQTRLDHDVQRTWDNIFDPPPPGDPRTNFERRRDGARYQERREVDAQRRANDRAEWCRSNPRAESCGRAYGRY